MKIKTRKQTPMGETEDDVCESITQISVSFTDEDNIVAVLREAAKTLEQTLSELRNMTYEVNSYLSDEEDGDHKEMSFTVVREPTAKEKAHAVKEWAKSKREQKEEEKKYKEKMIRWGYFNKDGSLTK